MCRRDISVGYWLLDFRLFSLMSRRRVAEPVSCTAMLAIKDSEVPIIGEVQAAKSCSHVDVIKACRRRRGDIVKTQKAEAVSKRAHIINRLTSFFGS
jgi:hypothetical protein